MTNGFLALRYAVRPRVLWRTGSRLGLGLLTVPLPPALYAALTGETEMALRCAAIAAVFAMMVVPRLKAPAPALNEVMVVAALGFLLPGLAMGWAMAGTGLPLDGALFEGISGVTTTGLSALPPPEQLPEAVVFTRSWLQWCGGLGIVILAVALVSGHESAAARRFAEVGEIGGDMLATLRDRARRAVLVYTAFTLLFTAAVTAAGVPLWDAFLYILAGVSTGGFSPRTGSLASLGTLPSALIMLSAFAGAVCFTVYDHATRATRIPRGAGTEVTLLLLGCALAALIAAGVLLGQGRPFAAAVRDGLLLGISAQTTTGYTPVEVPPLGGFLHMALLLPMMIGGNSGSTAGGIKSFRAALVLRSCWLAVVRTGLTKDASSHLRVGGRKIAAAEFESVAALIFIAVLVILLSWLPFLWFGYGIDGLFDVVSAVATTGLSTGVAGPELPIPLKAVLMADMLLGRLEFIAVLVLFAPGTWIGRRHPS